MAKKLFIFIVIAVALIVLIFAYNYFAEPKVNAPTINSENQSSNGFRGASGPPWTNGPTSPPPSD